MSRGTDEDEHSLEMHLPYIYKALSLQFPSANSKAFPLLVPILVGATTPQTERHYGRILAPYLIDETSIFIISSDFCHWGSRFRYTYYLPSASSSPTDGYALKSSSSSSRPAANTVTDLPIYESIAHLDKLAMEAVESGSHEGFLHNLRETGNTVCGRHPIGVLMAAVEVLRNNGTIDADGGRFRFVRYERSSDVEDVGDSSVSYASAFAVL